MNFTIDIPVEPYIKKFLVKELGQEPVNITRHDYIGIVIYDKIKALPPGEIPNCKAESKITLQLTLHQSDKLRSAYISTPDINRINLYLKKLFKDLLFNYLNAKMELKEQVGLNIKTEILNFCELYSIGESDYSYEAIKKAYYRSRMLETSMNICDTSVPST